MSFKSINVIVTGHSGNGVATNLAKLRRERGIPAAQLAKAAGISRQTVYATEAGTYIPNTAVALRLARILQTSVEELFMLAGDAPAPKLRSRASLLAPGAEKPHSGQAVQLCEVNSRLMATVPSVIPWYLPAADAIVTEKPGSRGKLKVHTLDAEETFTNRILIAGCDPGISVLSRHARSAGAELVLEHRNSSEALSLLKGNYVHVAGTHLRDEASGESNLPRIHRMFPRESVAVISFAIWEQGIVTARGNPKKIRGVEDFARKDVAIANRETGSGSRLLVDMRLRKAGIDSGQVHGYDRLAPGHLAAASEVRTGAVDCCVATGAAARIFGMHFIPLVSERYDLVMRRRSLELPRMQALLDAMNRSAFRRELEFLGGYDTSVTGRRMM